MNTTDAIQTPEDNIEEVSSPPLSFTAADDVKSDTSPMQSIGHQVGSEGKYLTFTLSQEDYGIGILKIKEIIGMMPITSVPQTPAFVKGVINLRGKVIPVIDLRLRFSMDPMDYNDRTCIIVVEAGARFSDITIGIVVDSVSEVLNIKSEDIEETPMFGTSLNTDYILGMAKIDNRVKILLDIDTVLGGEELTALSRTVVSST